jgi:hypothetical protein
MVLAGEITIDDALLRVWNSIQELIRNYDAKRIRNMSETVARIRDLDRRVERERTLRKLPEIVEYRDLTSMLLHEYEQTQEFFFGNGRIFRKIYVLCSLISAVSEKAEGAKLTNEQIAAVVSKLNKEVAQLREELEAKKETEYETEEITDRERYQETDNELEEEENAQRKATTETVEITEEAMQAGRKKRGRPPKRHESGPPPK